MRTRKNRELLFVLLAVAFVLSACGTLQIDTEPAVSESETIGESTVDVEPIPTQDAEPTDLAAPTELAAPEDVTVIATETVTTGVGTETAAGPAAELQHYESAEYRFGLSYPSSWSLSEVDGEEYVGPGSRSVQLSQGTVTLVIGYRRAGEGVAISGSGAPGGEFEVRGMTQMMGQDVDRYVIVYEGKDKVVMYGEPGSGPLALGGLEFSARLDDFNPDYDSVALSQAVQDEADMILNSLAITEAEGVSDSGSAGYDYSNWQSYRNEVLGYSLMYPGQADVMGGDRDQAVEFVGPIVGDEHWPWLTVQHFDSAFFRPPAGADVRQWLSESDIPYEPVDEALTIGGLAAVHYVFKASPQAYGRDEYYVINGDQLFKITLLHAGGHQDWALYEQFLDSITFAEAE